MGRTTPIPATEPAANTTTCAAKGSPSAPASPAASAAAASRPSAKVSVKISAIPSRAATSSQMTHGSIAASSWLPIVLFCQGISESRFRPCPATPGHDSLRHGVLPGRQAMMEKEPLTRSASMADRTAFRTCPLCEALCGLELTLDDNGTITRVRGDAKDPFSKGFICPKGATLGSLDGDPDRLAEPLIKGEAATWDEAFETVKRELSAVIERYGRDSVAVYVGNPTAHSLAGPLYVGALAKALGTRNLYTASTADQMPKHVSSGHMFGDPLTIPVPDLDRTDHLLMLGANPLESNGSLCSAPDFPGRLKAIRARGGKVVVVDPRRTRTAALADEHPFIRPGTDAFLLMALVHTLFAEELTSSPEHLEGRVNGLD